MEKIKLFLLLFLLLIFLYRHFHNTRVEQGKFDLSSQLPGSGTELSQMLQSGEKEAAYAVWKHFQILAKRFSPDFTTTETKIVAYAAMGIVLNNNFGKKESYWENGKYYDVLKKILKSAKCKFCKENWEIYTSLVDNILLFMKIMGERQAVQDNFKHYSELYTEIVQETPMPEEFKGFVNYLVEEGTIGFVVASCLQNAVSKAK